ncbi:hypothetical protein Pint_21806 [Pistacia integerrima]|uniref:Uncharacterized protein n=1 Tax=Pistacia integerrima TaxID=434235 RepID=A0ACC0X8Z0_9ROSI|nr:hypothetical protein Pint_21806 [Pistacia integerrima]
MGVHQLVLVLSQIILLFLPFKASAISCPSTCGNVSFWCPLGIGAGCYFEKGFEQPSHNQTDSTSAGCQSFCTCDPSQNATDCCDMIRTLPPNDYLFCDTRSGCNCNVECPHGCAAGIGSFLLLIGIWWLYKFTKRRKAIKLKQKFFKRNGGLLLQQQLSSKEGNIEKTRLFTSKELVKATDNYNVNQILGQGGQGTVYKGMLTGGKIVAIKKSKIVDESQVEEFINEVDSGRFCFDYFGYLNGRSISVLANSEL